MVVTHNSRSQRCWAVSTSTIIRKSLFGLAIRRILSYSISQKNPPCLRQTSHAMNALIGRFFSSSSVCLSSSSSDTSDHSGSHPVCSVGTSGSRIRTSIGVPIPAPSGFPFLVKVVFSPDVFLLLSPSFLSLSFFLSSFLSPFFLSPFFLSSFFLSSFFLSPFFLSSFFFPKMN